MYCILQIHIPTLINMLFKKYNKLKRELELKAQIVPFEIAFQLAQFWASFSCVRDWNQRTLQVSSEYPCELKFWHCMLISYCSTDWNYTSKEFVQYRVNKIFNSEFFRFSLGDISEQYGLVFLGYILVIGGAYLLVSFGPNSHEKLIATNIVKHLVGWPVLLYLVRYLS